MIEKQNETLDDFYWSDENEPHLERRKQILKKYPEVRELYGIDPKLKFKVIFLVIVQLTIAPFIFDLHWGLFLLISYVVGATITHSLFLAVHELSHNLAFKKKSRNNWLAIVANIPIVFPYAMSFRRYHLLHHSEQGHEHNDTDLPSSQEAGFFKGLFGKLVWAINQIIVYGLRPLLVHPKKMDKWLIINILFQIITLTLYIYIVGLGALYFLLLSFFLAGSLHPMAGHFISEHYVFEDGQETYSYYGPLNKLGFNVGYHNEHHDFPYIPGSRLPQLKKMAPEFYDSLYSHNSWVKVLYKFITDSDISLYNRVKRRADRE
ncbi:MAG: fatty acid desaturase [Balneolaceae bacterium]